MLDHINIVTLKRNTDILPIFSLYAVRIKYSELNEFKKDAG